MRRKVVISTFVCTQCELELPLPRICGKQRADGHIKDLYCPKCRRVAKFKEIKYNQYYKNLAGDKLA